LEERMLSSFKRFESDTRLTAEFVTSLLFVLFVLLFVFLEI